MSDLKKTIEEEYLINDVLKLIMEAQRLDEFESREEAQEFFDKAIKNFSSLPSLNRQEIKDLAEKLSRRFGFKEGMRLNQRIEIINNSYNNLGSNTTEIHELLSTIEIYSLFYRLINNYEPSVAGFLMEALLASAGKTGKDDTILPEGNPIADMIVVDEEGVKKLYSYKTLAGPKKGRAGGDIGGSFTNLIYAFAEAYQGIDTISYILFNKMGEQAVDTQSGKGFSSLDVYEQVVTLADVFESGRMERFFSPMTAYEQRRQYLIRVFKKRKSVLTEEMKQLLYGTPQQSISDVPQRMIGLMNEKRYDVLIDKMVDYSLETYDNAKIKFIFDKHEREYKRTRNKAVYDQFILGFLGPDRGRSKIALNMTRPENLQWRGSGAMPLAGIKENPGDSYRVLSNLKKIGINVNNRWTRFEISNKEFISKAEKVATINISFNDLIDYIQSSGDIIKNEIVKTYDLLNSLNNTVDLIFKEGDITRQTINKAKQDSQELADVTKSYEKSMTVVDR